ncbi:MAG: toll/interleukin-1 receptor domain-containing protein [Myxococcota bacterium]
MKKVFLSYPSEHSNEAMALGQALRAKGVDVWTDHWRIRSLRDRLNLPQRIDQAIRSCDAGVIVVSTRTSDKRWPKAERLALRDLGKPLGFVVVGQLDDRIQGAVREAPGSRLFEAAGIERCAADLAAWLNEPATRSRPPTTNRSWRALSIAIVGQASTAMAGMFATFAGLHLTGVYPLSTGEASWAGAAGLGLSALRFALWARGIPSLYIVDRYLPNDRWAFVWGVAMTLGYLNTDAARLVFLALGLIYLGIFLSQRLRGSPGELTHLLSAIYVAANWWLAGPTGIGPQDYDRETRKLQLEFGAYEIWMPTTPVRGADVQGSGLELSEWATQPLGSDASFHVVLWRRKQITIDLDFADLILPLALRDAEESARRELIVTQFLDAAANGAGWKRLGAHPSRLGGFDATEVTYSTPNGGNISLRYPSIAVGTGGDRRSVIVWVHTRVEDMDSEPTTHFFSSFALGRGK